jgi:hypothetical protein
MLPSRIKSLTWFGAILFTLAIAAPVRAQFSMPQVPGFSKNYPWFNEVPQYQGSQSFQYFLAYHPNIARALSRNPGLLYDANWRSQVPALQQYLANHPNEWQQLNGQNWSEGPAETQWGDYDDQHQWHDAYWWHRNNPDRFYDVHQNWTSLDSRWRDQDGAYDRQRQWHYGEWWYNQDPNWVTTNHPNWLSEHPNWENQTEQQDYRRQQAMREQNQQNNRPENREAALDQRQATIHQQTMRQENQRQQQTNQQRALDQRQANLQRQEEIRQDSQRRQPHSTWELNQRLQQVHREQLQTTYRQPQQAVHQRDPQQQAMPQQHNQQPRVAHDQQNAHGQRETK